MDTIKLEPNADDKMLTMSSLCLISREECSAYKIEGEVSMLKCLILITTQCVDREE